MTPTSHPNFTGDQEAAFVVAHYGDTHGLLIVVLSTTRSHGRGPSRARALPEVPLAPRREVTILDGTDFAPIDGRYLAFAGRCYGPGTPQQAERSGVRVVIGALARLFSPHHAIDTTATEVR